MGQERVAVVAVVAVSAAEEAVARKQIAAEMEAEAVRSKVPGAFELAGVDAEGRRAAWIAFDCPAS